MSAVIRIAVVLALAGVVLLAAAEPALAGGGGNGAGGWGTVSCSQDASQPGCQLGAGTGSSKRRSRSGTGGGSPTSSGGGGGGGGQSGPDPFYCLDNLIPYEPLSGPLSGPLAPPAGQTASSGAWYTSVCSGDRLNDITFYPPIWEANGPAAPPPPSPAQLAQSAYNKLPLTAPTIVLSPAGDQLVNLPTWLAVSGWGAKTASAGVPATATTAGVSVTATATPTRVVWSTGDGATVTCEDPGTVYTAGDDPASASPTCGHTYRTSSAGQPGATFTVTATVHWSVAWAGAGQAGTFPNLTTTATARVPVDESQALTTR